MSILSTQAINADLRDFDQNPNEFMRRLPPKFDNEGNKLDSAPTLFESGAIDNRDFVLAHDATRKEWTRPDESAPGRVAFAENDRAERLVDDYRYSGLEAMERNGFMTAKLNESPWSDDYWAIYSGILGKRYADSSFPASSDWKKNLDYIQDNPALIILTNGNHDAINRLSPAEKYDALVGDTNQSLTKYMWEQGRRYYDNSGRVESWMGICHGWAPAAYMLPRPTSSVDVLAADGTPITFYPSDIKALATLLWANARTSTRFVGGRCNDKDPQVDPATGRVTSGNCFDTNPGTWHLAVVNQIGASRRSMVMDATYDYEVWNQPIYSYSYSYFNPSTLAQPSSLSEATVLKREFQNDKFANFRDEETDSVVGIAMEVAYVVETSPTHKPVDTPDDDSIRRVRYLYDLELNIVAEIIGGEWYQNAHPDFLWTPAPGARALTNSEIATPLTDRWSREARVPTRWREAAALASKSHGVPLSAIVDGLIAFARS